MAEETATRKVQTFGNWFHEYCGPSVYPTIQEAWDAASVEVESLRSALGRAEEALTRILPTLYNGFEPDNQSKTYEIAEAALAEVRAALGK